MPVSKYATRAGKQYETDLMNYTRGLGHDVERLRLTGTEDEGDLLIRLSGREPLPSRYVIEAKRCKTMDLAGWIREAQVERDNYLRHRGLDQGMFDVAATGFVVVHHARGQSIGRSYVTTTLDDWLAGL